MPSNSVFLEIDFCLIRTTQPRFIAKILHSRLMITRLLFILYLYKKGTVLWNLMALAINKILDQPKHGHGL